MGTSQSETLVPRRRRWKLAIVCLAVLAGCDQRQAGDETRSGTPGDARLVALFTDDGAGLGRSSYGERAGARDCIERVTATQEDAGQLVDDAYRRFTVMDGDDYYGERCELGRNERRFGDDGGDGTAVLYREAQRRLTQASFRLPDNYPLSDERWQVVMQMKQTQPATNGGGTPVLALRAYQDRWVLMQSDSVDSSATSHALWSVPAQRNEWTRFEFDVNYSQDPELGSIAVRVDLNHDGDTSDTGEESPQFSTYTLKREVTGGARDDGIEAGESIPSHLRIGNYHNSDVPCPPPDGCSVEVADVRVLAAG